MTTRRRPLALLGFAALLLPPALQAQTLGFKGGVSVAKAKLGTSTLARDNRTGFVGGTFLNLGVGPIALQPELSYSRVGFGEKGTEDGLAVEYLTGTALLKLGFPLVAVKPSLFGGVSYGLRTRCSFRGESCSDSGLDLKGTDTSAVFGGDVAVFLGNTSIWADGRYSLGLSEINRTADVFRDVKNRSWQFQVGFGFKLRP